MAAAPALAEEYPPSDPTSNPGDVTPGGNGTDTGQQTKPATVAVPSDGETPAYTGAATTLALAVGVIALGAGAGLLVASRRRRS